MLEFRSESWNSQHDEEVESPEPEVLGQGWGPLHTYRQPGSGVVKTLELDPF